MTKALRTLSLVLAVSFGAAGTSFAQSLPVGAFKGESELTKGFFRTGDAKKLWRESIMTLIIQKDPANETQYYAILAEYSRVVPTTFHRKAAQTVWTPRLYTYHVEKISDREYAMKPLRVTEAGEVVVNNNVIPDHLELAAGDDTNRIDGAVLTRFDRKSESKVTVETIKFKGDVNSTWEDYVVGKFLGTKRSSGLDYFDMEFLKPLGFPGKDTNSELTQDRVAHFNWSEAKGSFDVLETAPKLYTFKAKDANNEGNAKVVNKIAVFVDIVNWKSFGIERFTTEELLLLNPEDPTDIGFYYERH
jgi:hypothetical protein